MAKTKNIPKRLPKKLYPYFWEIDQKKLNVIGREHYVLTRLLEYGDENATRWAWRNFTKKDWEKTIRSRQLSPRTKSFWTIELLTQLGKR